MSDTASTSSLPSSSSSLSSSSVSSSLLTSATTSSNQTIPTSTTTTTITTPPPLTPSRDHVPCHSRSNSQTSFRSFWNAPAVILNSPPSPGEFDPKYAEQHPVQIVVSHKRSNSSSQLPPRATFQHARSVPSSPLRASLFLPSTAATAADPSSSSSSSSSTRSLLLPPSFQSCSSSSSTTCMFASCVSDKQKLNDTINSLSQSLQQLQLQLHRQQQQNQEQQQQLQQQQLQLQQQKQQIEEQQQQCRHQPTDSSTLSIASTSTSATTTPTSPNSTSSSSSSSAGAGLLSSSHDDDDVRIDNDDDEENERRQLRRQGGIRWDEYNFPPCIHVIHFDLENDPIPFVCKQLVNQIYLTIKLIHLLCLINLISSIVFASSGISPGEVVFTSCLQLVIASCASWIALYQAYRGIAGEFASAILFFRLLWVCMMIFEFVFMLVSSAHVHGFLAIPQANTLTTNSTLQQTWIAFSTLESCMWAVILLLSAHCFATHFRNRGGIDGRSQHGAGERAHLHTGRPSTSSLVPLSSSQLSSSPSSPVLRSQQPQVTLEVKITRFDSKNNDQQFLRAPDSPLEEL